MRDAVLVRERERKRESDGVISGWAPCVLDELVTRCPWSAAHLSEPQGETNSAFCHFLERFAHGHCVFCCHPSVLSVCATAL